MKSIWAYLIHSCPQAFKTITLFDLNPNLNQVIDKLNQCSTSDFNQNYGLNNKNFATLIIDGTGIYNIFYNQDVDLVFGGDYINLINNVTSFINKLRGANIEPIFYFEGSGTSMPFEKKASKQLTYAQKILKFIKEKPESCNADNFKILLERKVGRNIYPPHKMAIIEIILRFECKVETRRNLCQEFMHEIVQEYRNLVSNGKDKVLGILSSNIEFMFHIPSIKLFHVHVYHEGQALLNNLQCKQFVQSELLRHLNLKLHQIPLLLVFLIHDIHVEDSVDCSLIETLFPQLRPNLPQNLLVIGLAQFIKTHFDVRSPRKSYNKLDTLIYGSSKHPNQKGRNNKIGFLQEQCRRYMVTWSKDLDPYKDIPYVSPFVFSLMKGHFISNAVLLESNLHSDGVPLTYVTYLTLLRGLIGVLLWLGPSARINETTAYDGHTFYQSHLNETETEYVSTPVLPITPEALKDLTKPDNYDDIWTFENDNMLFLRWSLLLATYSSNIPAYVLVTIEPVYVPLCLILNYLISKHCYVNKNALLNSLDVKAFIIQAIIINTLPQQAWNNETFLDLKWPAVRTVALATTFVYGVKMFYTAIALCGYPVQMEQTLIWHFFDGKLFHAISQKLHQGILVESICLGNVAIIQKLSELENVIYNRE